MEYDITNIKVFDEPDELKGILQKEIDSFGESLKSEGDMPDPYGLHDMDKAVELFTEAVSNGDKIKLIIDSDCDGLGTYTLWYNFFTHFPYPNIHLLITDRKKGYGFIPEYVDNDTKLYITSDNGITSVEATDVANNKGAKVIICDHHQPDPVLGLPQAAAIIDPYHPDDTFLPKEISGTFVLYFFLKALVDKYEIGIDAYNEFLGEIAITTISDVMPLTVPLNRFVVKDFVDKFCAGTVKHREYLNTFRTEVNSTPTAESFAFGLIPLINATQRMTTADHGALFLVEKDPVESKKWFEYIKGINNDRKVLQQTLLSYIEKYYTEFIDQPFIIIPGRFQKKYKGVQGIISGRLAETNVKPCIVLNYNEAKKEYSGSGRSIGDLHILDILRDNPYIKQVGGHQQALGITITEDNFDDFYTTLQSDIKKVDPRILNPIRPLMGEIPINKINWDFFQTISDFEPFGHKFKKPVFMTQGIIKTARLIGKQRNHLAFSITDEKGLIKFEGVQFFTTDVPQKGKKYNVFYNLDKDDFKGGKNLKLMANHFMEVK